MTVLFLHTKKHGYIKPYTSLDLRPQFENLCLLGVKSRYCLQTNIVAICIMILSHGLKRFVSLIFYWSCPDIQTSNREFDSQVVLMFKSTALNTAVILVSCYWSALRWTTQRCV